jgi:hypothetical protein
MKPTHKRDVSLQGRPSSAPVVAITKLLAMSCARYRKLRDMEAPEFVLEVERMLIERHMSSLTKANCACVN